MPDADVIVVGLGAMGSHALWRLARRGVPVIGVEQFEPGHDRGASHGESRIIRTAYAEGTEYVPLVRRAWELWRELDPSLVTVTGGLMLGRPDSPFVAGPLASAREHGLPYELLDADELLRRYPQHVVDERTVGFYESDAGFVRPELGILAAVSAARASGARVVTGSAASQVDLDGLKVLVDGRWLTCRHLVLAAGGWLPRLVPAFAGVLRPFRRVVTWFSVSDPGLYEPSRFPVFIRMDPYGRGVWYGFPTLDGSTVKVALHDWPGIDLPIDTDTGPLPPRPVDAQLAASVIGGALRGLNRYPVRMQTCSYTMTPDRHFVVGALPGHENVTVLGGFSGHGYKFAPVIGEAAAGLALDGGSEYALPLLSPARFAAA